MTPRSPRRLGWTFAAVAIVGVTAASLWMRPAIMFDPGQGLLAVEQRVQGRQNPLSHLWTADPNDISHDHLEPISWWPPGQQMLVYPLRRAGLQLGTSVKTLVLALWVLGIVGWSLYFSAVIQNRAALPWVIGVFALLRPSHIGAWQYTGGETVLWGLAPIVVLANLSAWRSRGAWGVVLAIVAGLVTTLAISVKYVAILLTVGVALSWLWTLARRMTSAAKIAAWFGGAAIGCVIVADVLGFVLHGNTPIAVKHQHPWPFVVAWSVAGPLLPISDVIEVAITATHRFDVWMTESSVGLLAGGALAVFLLWWKISGSHTRMQTPSPLREHAWRIAVSVAVVASAGLSVLLFRGANISWEARHLQYGGFLLLPFLADRLWGSLRERRPLRRAAAVACVLFFFVMPAAYGAVGLGDKVLRKTPAQQRRFGPTGVALWRAEEGEGTNAFIAELNAIPKFRDALLVTSEPTFALQFPQKRVLFTLSDDDWHSRRWHGNPTGGIAIVLPDLVPETVIGFIRDSFLDVHHWTEVHLRSWPSVRVWFGQ